MRFHKFINSLMYLIIPLVAKESRANENNGGIKCFFVLFIDKCLSQVTHFKHYLHSSMGMLLVLMQNSINSRLLRNSYQDKTKR